VASGGASDLGHSPLYAECAVGMTSAICRVSWNCWYARMVTPAIVSSWRSAVIMWETQRAGEAKVLGVEVVDEVQERDLDGVAGHIAPLTQAGEFGDGRVDEPEREVIRVPAGELTRRRIEPRRVELP